ncbi:3'(2'),5'-bisphosphate nucleotidase CysQ [Caulobacter sp. S45]|uniref:inositol monophosphatase family protein n=1 Tax=Caulobacter sp. S45 TaxID=1641861 RepID=UPI001576F86C|nr:3'(2'),5'-bisphosphate nucleotidase CysQ [Caulobacter sp. S45]
MTATADGDVSAHEDLALIGEVVRVAGRLALDRRAFGLKIERKADGSPVTDGDLAVDALLQRELLQARPHYAWLSEETPDDLCRLGAGRVFIVDPIDGTTAYVRGKPWFAVSVAVVQAGRPVAGVVFAPALDEFYAAVEGGGASCNGDPIRASEACRLEDCAMLAPAHTFDGRRWTRAWPAMRVGQRSALAYRMALVAAGRFDAAVSMGWKNDWDIAAGDLIAREAGAVSCDQNGRPLMFNTQLARNPGLVCAAPGVAPLILDRTAPIEQPAGV